MKVDYVAEDGEEGLAEGEVVGDVEEEVEQYY